jgi:hypothetical protein
MLLMTTTGDSLLPANGRSSRLVTYTTSEKGMSRKEGDTEMLLLPAPVLMEFWDGVAWRPEPGGRQPAVRFRLENPEETVVLR